MTAVWVGKRAKLPHDNSGCFESSQWPNNQVDDKCGKLKQPTFTFVMTTISCYIIVFITYWNVSQLLDKDCQVIGSILVTLCIRLQGDKVKVVICYSLLISWGTHCQTRYSLLVGGLQVVYIVTVAGMYDWTMAVFPCYICNLSIWFFLS